MYDASAIEVGTVTVRAGDEKQIQVLSYNSIISEKVIKKMPWSVSSLLSLFMQ